MIAVSRAPSKVIIAGEHFVVHGAKAIAAAIPKYTYCYVSPSNKLEIYSKGVSNESLNPIRKTLKSICDEFKIRPQAKISIRSEVPSGAGLGSSASVLVSVASAFLTFNGIKSSKELIFKHAMEGEKVVHGKPSGIDPAACIFGRIICYQIGQKVNIVDPLRRFSLAIVYTGRRRSTSSLIWKVTSMRERMKGFFNLLADFVSESSGNIARYMKIGKIKEIGPLLTANHAILSFIGVSNQELDNLVELCIQSGCYGSKLTGAGGGGCVIGLIPEGEERKVQNNLSLHGIDCFLATLPVGGVESWLE